MLGGIANLKEVLIAIKDTPQNVVDATLADITSLSLPIASNQKLFVIGLLRYDTTTANDCKSTWTVPVGCTFSETVMGLSTAATAAQGLINMTSPTSGNVNIGGARATLTAEAPLGALVLATFINAGNAGTVQFQAAKTNQTDIGTPADDLHIYGGSVLLAFPI